MSAVDKLLKDSANTNLDVQRLEKRLTDKIKSQTKIMEDKVLSGSRSSLISTTL